MSESMAETPSNASAGLRNDPKRLGRVLVGALFLAIFIGYYFTGNELADGTLADPGPGMFPAWIGIAGMVISLIVIVEALLGRSESGQIEYPRGRDMKDVLVFIGLVAIYYVGLLPLLGQYISSVLFAIAFIRFVGRDSWVKSIILGASMALILTFFFADVLGLQLPSGSILS